MLRTPPIIARRSPPLMMPTISAMMPPFFVVVGSFMSFEALNLRMEKTRRTMNVMAKKARESQAFSPGVFLRPMKAKVPNPIRMMDPMRVRMPLIRRRIEPVFDAAMIVLGGGCF